MMDDTFDSNGVAFRMPTPEENILWRELNEKLGAENYRYIMSLQRIWDEYDAKMEQLRQSQIYHPRCIARIHNSWELPKETI